MSAHRAQNVVLISLDTLRYDAVGACPCKAHAAAYGLDDLPHTPNLDRFLSEALYLPTARSPIPLTTPAHASVLTGLLPGRHGARALYKWAVAEEVTNLAQELGARGYETVAVVQEPQTHFLSAASGVLRGFGSICGDVNEACAHCEAAGRPALIFIHTFDIHTPYCWSLDEESRAQREARRQALQEVAAAVHLRPPANDGELDSMHWNMTFFKEAYQAARKLYDGRAAVQLFLRWYLQGVNWFDATGWPRILDALHRHGLYEDSLTVIFSDHGEALRPDAPGHPLMHIDTVLEDNLRVPIALRGPGIEPAVREGSGALIDIAPTIVDYLGMQARALGLRGQTDGRSLLPAQGDDAQRCYLAESWVRNPSLNLRPPEYAPGLATLVEEVWTPMAACAVRGGLKLIWHPGPVRLERFRQPSEWPAASYGRLKLLLRRTLPGPIVRILKLPLRLVRWLRRRRARARTSGDTLQQLLSWRPAAAFALDLAADPLEEHPVWLSAEELAAEPYAALWACLRSYWQQGRLGPPITLSGEGSREVLGRLMDLGYAE